MVKFRERSGWRYDTSANAGGQVSVLVSIGAGKGTITLKHPTGPRVLFNYESAGVGVGAGVKVAIGGALEEFPSDGEVWITDAFRGKELEIKDFTGACMILEMSAALGGGGSAVSMLLGIPPEKVKAELARRLPDLGVAISGGKAAYDLLQQMNISFLQTSAKAALIMKGMTVGASFGAGILGSVGYVWHGHGEGVVDLMPPVTYDGPTRISAREDGILIPADTLFDTAKWDIKRAGERSLGQAAFLISVAPKRRVIIYGHTDSVGGNSYNLSLSEKRAASVKKWLVLKGFVKESRITTRGYGESDPVASNSTKEGRAKNRRVEIRIVK